MITPHEKINVSDCIKSLKFCKACFSFWEELIFFLQLSNKLRYIKNNNSLVSFNSFYFLTQTTYKYHLQQFFWIFKTHLGAYCYCNRLIVSFGFLHFNEHIFKLFFHGKLLFYLYFQACTIIVPFGFFTFVSNISLNKSFTEQFSLLYTFGHLSLL